MDEDPVVICGMGCRLPGDVKSPSQFWDLVQSGRSAQSDVPANRFDIDKWYHRDGKRRGGIIARGGYFLSHDDSYRNFEPSFFGIHPLEASSMDPQQRKLLEVVYETFESAGVTLDQISGSQTACYVGCFTADFGKTLAREAENYWPYQSTGTDMTVLSNRVNYVFDLKGPSLTVDTACSSSLYAVHLACQGLKNHDFDAAVVAGTNIIMDVLHQLTATKLGILSPTSTCHTFDAAADRFGRGEGITALYIKRLSDAVADDDPIRAVIRATAINTNGKGLGISQPGVQGQEDVIRIAYAKGRLKLNETIYLECHGTGTPVGDPIEVKAIGNVFTKHRSAKSPLLLSSVKSQIGHTEGASGIASIQKVVMALEHGEIPATIGVNALNPALDLRDGRLKVVQTSVPWPTGYRRAGVNGFGYGGANAHAVIDSIESYFQSQNMSIDWAWRSITQPSPTRSFSEFQLLLASAHSKRSLDENITNVGRISRTSNLSDLAHSLFAKRTHFQHRAFAITSPQSESTISGDSWTSGETRQSSSRSSAFIFTGQGAQWPRMAYSLVKHFAVAHATIERLQQHLDKLSESPSWTLLQALAFPPETSLMMTDVTVTVTLCTAVQICLVDVLKSWNVTPLAVAGHSSGEAAAAYCAGLLTAGEAIVTSYYRALSMKKNPTAGAMMAVGLGAETVREHLRRSSNVYIACQNSPQSVTLSGTPPEIDRLETGFKQKGIFARKVKSSGFANHSPLVEAAAQYFFQNYSTSLPPNQILAQRLSNVPMYSCITGSRMLSHHNGPEYWAKNISAPVLFDQALQSLLQEELEVDCLIEIGPHCALAGPVRQTLVHLGIDDSRVGYLPTLIRGNDGVHDMLRCAGMLHIAGQGVDIGAVNSAYRRNSDGPNPKFIVDLPGYHWTYDKIYWSETRKSNALLFRKYPRHDLLGTLDSSSTSSTWIWRNQLHANDVPWIKDHTVGNSILVPASAYIAMAVEAIRQWASIHEASPASFTVNDVTIASPIRLSGKDGLEVVLEFEVSRKESCRFKISSTTVSEEWTEHASGVVSYDPNKYEGPSMTSDRKEIGSRPMTSNKLYKHFESLGLKYGPFFQTLGDIRSLDDSRVEADISMKSTSHSMVQQSEYFVHPATMDGCFQLAVASIMASNTGAKRSYLPSKIPSMTIWRHENTDAVERGVVSGHARSHGLRAVQADLSLAADGAVLMKGRLELSAVEGLVGPANEDIMPEPYQRLSWMPDLELLESEIHPSQTLQARSRDQKTLPRPDERKSRLRRSMDSTNTRLPDSYSEIQGEILNRILHLLLFERPGLALLEIGGDADTQQAILNAGRRDARYSLFETYLRVDQDGLLEVMTGSVEISRCDVSEHENHHQIKRLSCVAEGSINIIIVSEVPVSLSLPTLLRQVDRCLSQNARVILCFDAVTRDGFEKLTHELSGAGWSPSLTLPGGRLILAQRGKSTTTARIVPGIYLLHDGFSPEQISVFAPAAAEIRLQLNMITVADIPTLPKGSHVISMLELKGPVIANITRTRMDQLKTLFKTESIVHWVTTGRDPRTSLMAGMMKCLRAETPGLDLRTIHVDEDTCDWETAASLILRIVAKTIKADANDLAEICIRIRDETAFIPRYTLDEPLNSFDCGQSAGVVTQRPFASNWVDEEVLQLDFRKIGHMDTFFFRSSSSTLLGTSMALPEGFIKIAPTAFAINQQNARTLQGVTMDPFFSHECFGIVQAVGQSSKFRVGQTVLSLAGSMIENQIVVGEYCSMVCSEDRVGLFLGLLEAFVLAYLALNRVLRCRRGDKILLQSEGSDGVMKHACCLLGKRFGAEIKYPEDIEKGLSVKLNAIIDIDGGMDTERYADVLGLDGKIICFALNNSSMSKTRTTSEPTRKQTTVPTFTISLEQTKKEEPETIDEALRFVADFLQNLSTSTSVSAFSPIQRFRLDQLPAAVDAAIESAGSSQRVILTAGADTSVPFHTVSSSVTKFRSDGAYLLIGCLGGLGCCLTRWMVDHGAVEFVLMSRSGLDKTEARELVQELKAMRAKVKVVRGDVYDFEDVARAVAAATRPIRGVVQAAVVYDDTRFDAMTPESFQAVLRPKVQGSWNLHRATLKQPLEFFVMLSSSIGMTGATTQTHYAAANGYLDGLAEWRRKNGLPGTSLSLGMVTGIGRFQDDRGLAELLRRRGAYDISEAEMLRMMEVACFHSAGKGAERSDVVETSLLVTAADPTKLSGAPSGDGVPEWWMNDARFEHIKYAARKLRPRTDDAKADTGATAALNTLIKTSEPQASEVRRLVKIVLLEKLCNLLMMSDERLEASLSRPLSDLGMDSIIGTELQSWLWRELKVALDFMELFATRQTLSSLMDLIVTRLL